jgi:uncharacterized C2H2 Zn-finger protein
VEAETAVEMKCDRCGREFKSEHSLLTHIGIAHGEEEHLIEEERLRTCYLKLKRMLDLKMYTVDDTKYVLTCPPGSRPSDRTE